MVGHPSESLFVKKTDVTSWCCPVARRNCIFSAAVKVRNDMFARIMTVDTMFFFIHMVIHVACSDR